MSASVEGAEPACWADLGSSYIGPILFLTVLITGRVALVADAILDCSKRGGIILDVFAGSGTTLIAAEKAGRRGYGIEIDCHYADIIIRRFDEVFGLKAVHAESKLDFERLTNERFKEKRHGQKAKNGKGHRAKDR